MVQKRPNVLLLAKFRQLHSYFAMFAAPSILFFCLTGILQLFSFHEAHGAYQPPAFLQAAGSLHKNQNFNVRRPAPDMAKPADARAKDGTAGRPDKTAHWTPGQILLKTIFALASVAAMVSTGLGMWVGLSFGPRRRLLAWLLTAGVAVPIVIALVQVV